MIQFLKGTTVVDGRRAGFNRCYEECPHCGGRFVQLNLGARLPCSADDWNEFVESQPNLR